MNLKEGSLMENHCQRGQYCYEKAFSFGQRQRVCRADCGHAFKANGRSYGFRRQRRRNRCKNAAKAAGILDEIPEAVKHHIDKHRYSGGTVVAGTGDNAAEFVVTPISADGELYGHLVTTQNFSLSGGVE